MLRRAAPAILIATMLGRAQPPAVSQNGVMNAASQFPPALAGSAISRGALFQIKGVRLAAPGLTTQVRVFRDTVSLAARTVSVSPRRVDAIMPTGTPLGRVSLEVTVGKRSSTPASIVVVASNPALFTRPGTGWGAAIADNVGASGARMENTIYNSASPGQHVTLAITGRGNAGNLRVFVGGKAAPITSAPRRIDEGREELTIRVPRDVPEGCFVPVMLASSEFSSNVAALSVQAGGGKCGKQVDRNPPLEGPRTGILILGRTRTEDAGREMLWDEAVGVFAEVPAGPISAPLVMPPPPATCTFFGGSYQSGIPVPRSPSSALADEIGGRGLVAGSEIVIAGQGENRTITAPTGTPGVFIAKLGGDDGPPPARPPFFRPGGYQVSGGGGAELDRFKISVPSPPEFEWTNRDQVNVVDRAAPLTVTWRGVAPGRHLAIVVMNVDPATTALGTCLCVADPAAGRFTVPASVLRNLPRGEEHPDPPLNIVEVWSAPIKADLHEFSPRFTTGIVISMYASAKRVSFR